MIFEFWNGRGGCEPSLRQSMRFIRARHPALIPNLKNAWRCLSTAKRNSQGLAVSRISVKIRFNLAFLCKKGQVELSLLLWPV